MTRDGRSRISEEDLDVLAGKTRNRNDSAVRWRDLPGFVDQAIRTAMQSVDGAATRVRRLTSFRAADFVAGFYSWAVGTTSFPPPAGRYGSAIYLPRNSSRMGTWIASAVSGAQGQNRPRLFVSTTSGVRDDWGRWREILTSGGIMTPVAFEAGEPAGGLMEVVENANGVAFRFASGVQICTTDLAALTRASADRLDVNWTFPAPFIAAPVVSPSLPSSGHVDVTAVELGSTSCAATTTGAAVNVARAYGAPSFAATAEIPGAKALAIGMWGEP